MTNTERDEAHAAYQSEPQMSPACGWCGYPVDCTPDVIGKSLHHMLCCADQRPSIHTPDAAILARIMREESS